MEVSYFVFLFAVSAIFAISPDIDLGKVFTGIFFYLLNNSERNTNETTDDTEREKEVIPYEDKYKKEFRLLCEMNEYKEKNWKHTFVMEYTPLGNVIMRYDDEYKGFVYYSEKVIPYRFLDTVARKFALTYNCKEVVVDVEKLSAENEEKKKKEIETYENETRENNDMRQEDKKQSIKPEKKSVFAKLKKYNNNSRQVNANMTPTNNKKQTTNMNDNVVYETNKFSREGLLSSFMMLEQPTRKLKENATLTFKDFKMMKKKKLSII